MTFDCNLIGNTDAQEWARIFVLTVRANPEMAFNEATMVGWFANAIMNGHDKGTEIERKRHIVTRLHEIIFTAAGAAAGECLPSSRVFPADEITEAVNKVIEKFGIPRREN